MNFQRDNPRNIDPFLARHVSKLPQKPEDFVVNSQVVNFLQFATQELRRLDDKEGGNLSTLSLVNQQLKRVDQYLSHSRMGSTGTRERLVSIYAQLSQLAGWMAYDSEQHGAAKHHFQSSISAAREIGDDAYIGYTLAFCAYQAIHHGGQREAIGLAAAASETARHAHPAVQAFIASWKAHAHAVHGELAECQQALDRARSFVSSPSEENPPDWLYWVDGHELSARRAHALLALARHNPAVRSGLLEEAQNSLLPKAFPQNSAYPRSATYNTLWLMKSHLWEGDLDRVVDTGTVLLNHKAFVCSPRSVAQLRLLNRALGGQYSMPIADSRIRTLRTQVRRAVDALDGETRQQ